MVSMGDFSKELCGGTHLDNTAQVGVFKVIGEESVSAGTRRITALTGSQALTHLRRAEAALAETATLLRVPPTEVPHRVAALVKELRDLKKHSSPKATGDVSAEKLLAEAADVGGVRVVVAEVPGADAGMMRQLIDQLRKQASPIAVLLGSRETDKVTLVAGISRDLQERGLDAGQWIRGAAEAVGGRGGGKADMAQAGGKRPEKLPEALEIARAAVATSLAS
jgi:alanyl-tRNA synthetase